MKYFTILAAWLFSFSLIAQTTPAGFDLAQADLDALESVNVGTFVFEELMADALEQDKHGALSIYGKIADYPINPATHGVWTMLENGDRMWQFRFHTSGAKAVNVFFERLYLPEGSSLFVYAPDRSWFEGPYTSNENSAHGYFQTAEVFGEEAILEYYEPATVIGKAQLQVRGFGHYFRFIQDPREERGGSEACQVDVNCPEGGGWAPQRNAVVRLSIPADDGVGLCTGTLVNNTSKDCKNYILTAYHCTIDSSPTDLLSMAVRFNYHRSGCGTGSASSTQQRVGVIQRANSNDGGGSSGSDFSLCEMTGTIPESYDAYYAGWDVSGIVPASGGGIKVRGIHHPSGDVKKISTSNNIASGNWGASNTHWRVEWLQTETNWGVTEGGSSGSPIFDMNKRIIGTLTGGGSFCAAPTADDFYGKMDRHWTGNPNSAGQKLKVWLDSGNTGITILEGSAVDANNSAQPCGGTAVGVNEFEFEYEDIKIYPALASDRISIATSLFDEVKEVRIFGSDGALVKTLRLEGEITQLPVDQFASGLYYVSFVHITGTHLTKKFSVIR